MIINAIIQVYHHHKIIVTIHTEISHIVRLKLGHIWFGNTFMIDIRFAFFA